MNIEVSRLNRNMSEEYIDFFDNRAFSDGSAEKGCYCVWHHWTDKHEYERSLLPENERPYCKRDYAKELIQNGILNCGGSASMYISHGFEIIDIPDGIIARKKIR